MYRLSFAFVSIDSITNTSSFSKYSNFGLSKESQVDIVSSKETEAQSDLHGEISMLLGKGRAETFVVEWSSLVQIVFKQETPSNDSKHGVVGKVEVSFFLATLEVQGTFKNKCN